MELTQDKLKRTMFSCAMSDMPQQYREYFNVAFMFRRKYINTSKKSPESLYESATDDMRIICEAYGNDPLCMGLLLECYDDIVRQVEKESNDAEQARKKQPEQCRMAL